MLAGLIFIFIVTIYLYFKWSYTYWKRHGFLYTNSQIPYGSFRKTFFSLTNPAIKLKILYDDVIKNGHKYLGTYVFDVPRLLVVCPNLMQSMLQKDFSYFTDRGFYHNEDDPLSENLFAIGGKEWRDVRNKLSTSFTLSKLKAMIPIIKQCGHDLRKVVNAKHENNELIDIKDIAVCYNINVIASCGFGLDCNSVLNESEFKRQGSKIFDFSSPYRTFKTVFAFIHPAFAKSIGIKLFDKDTTTFFTNLVKETIQYRKRYDIVRHDMINSLMELGSTFDDIEIKKLAAQAFIFFSAGFETTSNTLTFCLYELSKHAEIQERLRNEICSVLSKYNILSYEALLEMKYMDQVISETLRKYPPLMYITRVCVKDYCIPNTNNVIPKGTNVDFCILGVHHDPRYYSEPEKFDPDRFYQTSKHETFVYLPFGAGPRKCIGIQLGLINIKTALTMLLSKFAFALNKNTIEPVECHPRSFTFTPKHEIFLNVKVVNYNTIT
ncbi:hypothetical protein FQA39_LY11747 [Lamprigera yunnana]|nr:hypothetical protein FQA39_LY11747 [Lamprigera yunnana]